VSHPRPDFKLSSHFKSQDTINASRYGSCIYKYYSLIITPIHIHNSMATSEAPPLLPAADAARRSDTLRFHTSPPPSLTARFALGTPQSVSMTGEDDTPDTARTFPGELRDPQGTLNRVSRKPLEVRVKLITSSLPIWYHQSIRIVTQTSWLLGMNWKRYLPSTVQIVSNSVSPRAHHHSIPTINPPRNQLPDTRPVIVSCGMRRCWKRNLDIRQVKGSGMKSVYRSGRMEKC
jgi:hypothetical protein